MYHSSIPAPSMIEKKEIELGGKKFIIYLKKVPTKLDELGNPINFTERAFIREIEKF